ncbi:unnamed protein product [Closterium sp. NIES-65]|nr:unnamed protein product [Closterium sp. NIES-65]
MPSIQVDIAEVKNLVDKLKTKLSQRYIEPDAKFGGGTNSRLMKFLEKHSKDRTMQLTGLNADGEKVIEAVELHEEKIGTEGGSDLNACYDLGKRFAQALIKSLSDRMADLRHFDGVQFFRPCSYPYRLCEQDMWFSSNMDQLLEMFSHQLPGITAENIEPEIRLFTVTLEKKFKDQNYDVDWAGVYQIFDGEKLRKPAT